MATYKDMVDKDIEFMYSIHDYCNRTAWLQDLMLRIVSNHPLKDVTTIIWIVFFIGVIELGSNHFWVVMFNLVVVVIARRVLEAKRPVEFDPDLQPTTDLNAESYAFPSLESYMSVVIIGHMFVTTKYLIILPLGGMLIFLVGFSRVYSRSRFPHQIVGSWILGVFGLVGGFAFCSMMKIHKMTKFQHQTFVGLAVAGLICHFAISMENNDSRLMGVKKTEFKRVILDILHSGTEKSEETKEEASAELEPVVFANSPRTLAVQAAQQQGNNEDVKGNKKSKRVKHDSFYFLQKGLESRDSPLSTSNLRQRSKKESRAGEFSIPRKVPMGTEDAMFHDSYSETSQGDHRYRSKV